MERVQVLLCKKELRQISVDIPNLFKKANIDCYMERPSTTFYNGKKQCFNNFYYGTFIACYTTEYKSIENCEYQSDELDDNLTGNGHGECSYSPKINLMILGETIQCRKAG